MAGYQVIFADEDVQLAGSGNTVSLIEDGEVQHDEKVGVVIVNLGTLHTAEHIVQRQCMEVEVISQVLDFFVGRLLDIVPRQFAVAANLVDAA